MERNDLARLHRWFDAYCRSFYTASGEEQRAYLLKLVHTRRVCTNMARLTGSLELNNNDRLIAEAVALCHDVGRFPQFCQYRTFRDADSVNHGTLGAHVLADEQALDHLPAVERAIISRSVALHNVFQLPEQLDERTQLLVKLVRDADKLDIWRVFIEYYALPEAERASAVMLGLPDLPECSSEVLACLERGEIVRHDMLGTVTDFKLLQLSWAFDLNFDESFRMADEQDCIGRLAATLPADARIVRALRVVREFVERQMKAPRLKSSAGAGDDVKRAGSKL